MIRVLPAALTVVLLSVGSIGCRHRESAAAGPCPDGASLKGDAPPKGTLQWCAREDGVKDGRWTEWHPNGHVKTEGQHVDGKMEGRWVTYFDTGIVKVAGVYHAGLKDGEWLTNYEDGKKNRLDVHRAGAAEVPFTVWREDGSVWVKATTVASHQDGDYTEWYPDGKVAAQGRYDHGEKVGKWSYFDARGNPSEVAQGDGAH